MIFQGFKIRIENPKGSTRKGVDESGTPWSVTMSYPYGEIVGTEGADGDPVDCFIGDNPNAKFVYIIHQTKKNGNGWDEDKAMLGFNDLMQAKQAYYSNFDLPDHFYGSVSTITVDEFRKRVVSNKAPQLIFAGTSKVNNALLHISQSAGPGIGIPVTVDGFHGRGVVVRKDGERWTVRFRNGLHVTRDIRYIHSLTENTVAQEWRR